MPASMLIETICEKDLFWVDLKENENRVFVGFERKEDLREKGGDFLQPWPKEGRDKEAIGMVFSALGSKDKENLREKFLIEMEALWFYP